VATHVERYIEVEVPVRAAYDQWTQFEDFPRFMSGVEQVRQVGGALTHWVAEIAGVRREWDAAILEQVPDQKIAWAATTGATNAGAVYFEAIGADRTRVRLTLDYEPEGLIERVGDLLDLIERTAVADLDRFKQFIESRRTATGGWRGAIDEGEVQAGSETGSAGATGTVGSAAAGAPVAVGPTSGTRGTVATEPGPAPGVDEGHAASPGAGHSGGPVSLGSRTADTGGTVTAEPTRNAAFASTGEVGFGTDTGMTSHDPESGVLTEDPGAPADDGTSGHVPHDPGAGVMTGFPGDRTPSHLGTRAESAGVMTGFPGDRTPSHLGTGAESADDPVAGVMTGFPGDRTPSHLGTGAESADDPVAGVMTGFPGDRTPSHLSTGTEAAGSTDPGTADQRDEPATDQPVAGTDTRSRPAPPAPG
jgi:hypothetical protein